MKTHITWPLCLIILLSLFGLAQAQAPCGFSVENDPVLGAQGPESGPYGCMFLPCDQPFNRDAAIFSPASQVLKVHLMVHLIRDNNGNGPTLQEVEDMLIKTRNDFRGISADSLSAAQNLGWTPGAYDTGIDFCWSLNVVDNSYLATAPSNVVAAQVNQYPTHQINVIVNGNQSPYGAVGTATTNLNGVAPGAHVWVNYSEVSKSHKTLSHEIGHYFGLLHTFDRNGCGPCMENMNMTAAARDTTGDKCSDTDPSPAFNGCQFTGLTELCTGRPYSTQFLSNIMSYSWANCGVHFTPQQGGRMRCFIQSNYQNMISFIASGCPEIPIAEFSTGGTFSCPGSSIQFNDESWNAVAWAWDFGDGSTSFLQNPTHAYAQPGTYTVKLSVMSGTNLTDVETKIAMITVSGGLQIPYTFSFNQAPSNSNGWTAKQDPRYTADIAKWRRMSSLSFVPTAPVTGAQLFTNLTHSMGTGAYYYNSCYVPSDAGLRKITGPNGVQDTSCFFICSRSPLPGQYDALISPPMDLSSVTNPIMSFHFSHLPAGTNQPGMTCDWSFPGLSNVSPPYGNPRDLNSPNIQPGHPCYVANCPANNPNCNRTNWGAGEVLNDTLKVYVSTDCGFTWNLIWADNGENLNTVPNEVCAPFVYVPRDASVWRKLEFDLCPYIGQSNVQFMISFVQDKYAGNMYVDEFYVGPGASTTLSVSTQTTGDCGIGTGTINSSITGGNAPYAYSVHNPTTGLHQSNLTGYFTGLTAGTYTVTVSDSAGNCAKTTCQVGVSPTLPKAFAVTGSSCGAQDGVLAVTYASVGASQYNYTLRNSFGQVVTGPVSSTNSAVVIQGLSTGAYFLESSDNIGNCANDTVQIPVANSLMPQTVVTADACSAGNGSISFSFPGGIGNTYQIRHIATGQTFSGQSNQFLNLVAGDYVACAFSPGAGCGCDTVTVNASTQLNVSSSVYHELCFGQNGSIVTNVNNAAQGGSLLYELYNGNSLLQTAVSSQTSFAFTGLSFGTYDVRVSEMQGSGCAVFQNTVYHQNAGQADVYAVNGNCSYPAGDLGVLFYSNPPISYTVYGQSGIVATGSSPISYFSLPGFMPGDYFVTLTDSAGNCYADSISFQHFSSLPFQTTVTDATCGNNDGNVLVDMSQNGGSIYSISLANTDSSSQQTQLGSASSFTFGGLAPGNYTILGSDSTGACFLTQVTVGTGVGCCVVPTADFILQNPTTQDFITQTSYSSMASGLEYHVIDTFVVTQSLNFNACTFWMDSSAVIYIMPGVVVDMHDCEFRAGCNYMWDAIVISDQSSTLVLDSCRVMDAENGVVSDNGGRYLVSNSDFQNNWVSMQVKNFGTPFQGSVQSTSITSDPANMMEPHAAQYAEVGIYVSTVDTVLVGSATSGATNHISKVAVGIYSELSDLRVVNTVFKDIVMKSTNKPTPFQAGYGTGIYATGLPGYKPMWVYNLQVGDTDTAFAANSFESLTFGIKAENNMNVLVEENHIDKAMVGILLQKHYTNELQVSENLLTNTLMGVKSQFYTGSVLKVEGNTILSDASHRGTGIMVSDITTLNLSQYGSTLIKNNSIDFYGLGINGNATGRLTIQDNDVRIHGNIPLFGWGAGINLTGCDSAQVLENTIESTASYSDSVSGVRVVLSAQANYSCNTMTNCGTGMHFYGPSHLSTISLNTFDDGKYGLVLENNGLVGQQGASSRPAGNKWLGVWSCNPSSSMVLSKNTNANQVTYFARPNTIEKPSLACNIRVGGSRMNILSAANLRNPSCGPGPVITPQIARTFIQGYLSENMPYAVNAAETQAIDMEFIASLLIKYGEDSLVLDKPTLAQLSGPASILQSLSALNNHGLGTEHTIASQKADDTYLVNNMQVLGALGPIMRGDQIPANVDQQNMSALALECPLTMGRAVFQARSVVGLSHPEMLFNDFDCENMAGIDFAAAAEAPLEVEIEVFPNPTLDWISISSEERGEAILYSMAGVKLQDIALASGITKADLSTLPSGVYLLEYALEHGKIGTAKIIKN